MSITNTEIKKLWGKAAGRCSKPGCAVECIKYLDPNEATVIGEMAHVIAKQPKGPRGDGLGGTDKYENLILLCPTHHTEVDKAPEGTYSIELLLEWKRLHEKRISDSFKDEKYHSKKELGYQIKCILMQNHQIWISSGPESEEAKRNPISNLVVIWNLRKLSTIVPNNRKIINIIENNIEVIDIDDLNVFYRFIEHAEGFERNCYERTEGVLKFPVEFSEVINRYARK